MSEVNMMNSYLTDLELAMVAERSTNPHFQFDPELYDEAAACLNRYYATREAAIRTFTQTTPESLNDPADMKTVSDFHDFYFCQIESALAPLTLSEKIDRVYRLNEALSLSLADYPESKANVRETIAALPGYQGEISEDALRQLVDQLSQFLAALNTTQLDLRSLTGEICAQSAATLADILVDNSRSIILREAMSIYTLAHEGKLSQYPDDITMAECVQCTAVSYDLDAIQKAENRGEIASAIGSALGMLLTIATMICCIFVVAPIFGAMAVAASSPALGTLFTILFLVVLLTPHVLCINEFCLHEDDSEGIINRICDMTGNLCRYLVIVLPAKVRDWINRRFGSAPAGASASVIAEEEILEGAEETNEVEMEDAPPIFA